jgi:hypothetical protein
VTHHNSNVYQVPIRLEAENRRKRVSFGSSPALSAGAAESPARGSVATFSRRGLRAV